MYGNMGFFNILSVRILSLWGKMSLAEKTIIFHTFVLLRSLSCGSLMLWCTDGVCTIISCDLESHPGFEIHSVIACEKGSVRDWIWLSTVQEMMGEANSGWNIDWDVLPGSGEAPPFLISPSVFQIYPGFSIDQAWAFPPGRPADFWNSK